MLNATSTAASAGAGSCVGALECCCGNCSDGAHLWLLLHTAADATNRSPSRAPLIAGLRLLLLAVHAGLLLTDLAYPGRCCSVQILPPGKPTNNVLKPCNMNIGKHSTQPQLLMSIVWPKPKVNISCKQQIIGLGKDF